MYILYGVGSCSDDNVRNAQHPLRIRTKARPAVFHLDACIIFAPPRPRNDRTRCDLPRTTYHNMLYPQIDGGNGVWHRKGLIIIIILPLR